MRARVSFLCIFISSIPLWILSSITQDWRYFLFILVPLTLIIVKDYMDMKRELLKEGVEE